MMRGCVILVALLLYPIYATAQTCAGHIKTQAQLLTEWQSCVTQGLVPGCLTPSRVQDIICSGGALSQPICALTAASTVSSDAATCATNSQNSPQVNSVTLTGATTLALPGNLPSGGGESMLYMITHSGASDGPTLAAGFEYPGGVQPPECNGSTVVANCWSIGTQTDWLPCVTIDGSHIGCGSVLTNVSAQVQVWSATQLNSNLSGGGTTIVTTSLANNWAPVFASIGHTTGQYYWETQSSTADTTGAVTHGIGNTNSPVVSGDYIGSSSNSVGITINSSTNTYTLNWNSTQPYTVVHSPSAGTDRVGHALSLTNGTYWWSDVTNNPGVWYGSSSTPGNPVTNTGGFNLLQSGSTITSFPVVPAMALYFNGGTGTGYFIPSSWIGTPPSGFGAP
jgi:hypothetical protein